MREAATICRRPLRVDNIFVSYLFARWRGCSGNWLIEDISNKLTLWKWCPSHVRYLCAIFRLDALALSVIATATWLGGWVSVTAGIVSKRLNLSENFLDHLVGPSFKHLGPLTPIPNSMGNPFIGALNTWGWKNWRFLLDFRRTSPFISETVRDRPMVTMER